MHDINEKKLFIFDWDGTLSTSTLIVAGSRFFRKSYKPHYIEKMYNTYKTKGSKSISIELKQDRSKFFAILYDFYARFYMPRSKKNTVEILKALRKKNKIVALFSDSRSYRLMSEVRALNMSKYFDFMLSASSVGMYKPDPTGILFIIDKYGVSKNNVVYVGDTVSDIMASRFAGVSSCIVADGLESYERIKKAKPDYLFKTTTELYDAIQ